MNLVEDVYLLLPDGTEWAPDITDLPGIWVVPWGATHPVDESTERDRIPEALPEVERLPEPGNDADDADDDVASDAKPLAGQEPG